MFSALQASTVKGKRHDFRKFRKNLLKISRLAIFFSIFFKQIFPAIISVPFPRTWRRKSWLIFLFWTILFFSKNMSFLFNFFENIEKTWFFVKIFWCQKLPFENRDDFFPDGRPVNEHSFRRFLIYLENCAIFDFFGFFFYETRRSAVFQPTCRKCMLGDNSILPVSESVPFENKWDL